MMHNFIPTLKKGAVGSVHNDVQERQSHVHPSLAYEGKGGYSLEYACVVFAYVFLLLRFSFK